MAKEVKKFEAEVKQILDLMVHSLYSQKEIFLRELISNSSDAMDKIRFEGLSNKDWNVSASDLQIRLTPNKEAKTLTIEDNGIGMSREEVEANIGTIARSGTSEFLKNLKEAKDRPELIGQFGVGFYSAFMVADKITLQTQKAGSKTGVLWESAGDGTYSIDEVPKPGGVGTKITLHLKDEDFAEYTNEWKLKEIVKKHSDFVSFPIKMETHRTEPERDEKGQPIEGKTTEVVEDEILNSQGALWTKPASEIKDEEYNEFYKHISKDWSDPARSIHFRAEGTQEFTSLMYIPSQVPYDFYMREMKWGLQLYVKRVFIMDHCEDLLPSHLRFVKGVVDSSDLSLNVSREILQQDHQVQGIKKALTNKVLGDLKKWKSDDRAKYEKFWSTFGATLKEGIQSDFANKEKLMELSLFRSTKDESWTSLAEYKERMPKDQKAIFFMTGDQLEELQKSPLLERFQSKGFEVFLMTDAIDEWVTSSMGKYEDLEFVSILDEKLDIDSEDEKKAQEVKNKAAEKEFEPVLSAFKSSLEDQIKDVRISSRLVSTPVCLVSGSNDPSARMERIVGSMGGKDLPKTKRILEINPEHQVVKKMQDLADSEKANWARVLYSQALLQEGSPLENPIQFSQDLSSMMGSLSN